jgi:precorrin-8X/cobalt-precorrin-8 methylmutase
MDIQKIAPMDIERESFRIITEELGDRVIDPELAPILKRVIHTSADFEYADTLYVSKDAIRLAKEALKSGASIVTDTQMALAGINKRTAEKLGCRTFCFMSDDDVAKQAKAQGVTRARVSMDKAVAMGDNVIFAIGNAPTALIRLREHIDAGYRPKLIIGVPVGFVNVVASKELIIETDVPCIVARGRKGGSNIAACIVNALLYMIDETRGGNL